MNHLAVTLTAAAKQDIIDIATYIALDSPTAARLFESELWSAVERIGLFPEAGRKTESLGVTLHATRISRRFRRYLIFTRRLDESNLEVVRILHGARDLSALFDSAK